MEACWDADPNKRPDFEQIAEDLLEVIVHVAISDKIGRFVFSFGSGVCD